MPAPVQAPYGSKAYYSEIGRRGGLASAAARRARTTNALLAELQSIAADVAAQARRNAMWSNDIQRAIQVGTAKETDEGLECDITVDLSIAPQARAFEYGSGIHGKKGVKYIIAPKDAPALAFEFTLHWPPGNGKFLYMAGTPYPRMIGLLNWKGYVQGLTFWNYVEHPGVEARPYLQPAIDEVLPKIAERVGHAFVASIQGMFNEEE